MGTVEEKGVSCFEFTLRSLFLSHCSQGFVHSPVHKPPLCAYARYYATLSVNVGSCQSTGASSYLIGLKWNTLFEFLNTKPLWLCVIVTHRRKYIGPPCPSTRHGNPSFLEIKAIKFESAIGQLKPWRIEISTVASNEPKNATFKIGSFRLVKF